MKIKLRLITFSLFALLLFQNSELLAQSSLPTATFNSDTGITLDVNSSLSDTYEIDISLFGYSDADATSAAKFIESKSDLLTAKSDFANKRIIITLKRTNSNATGWTLADWNNHLKNVL